jgi:uncharacterized membrane protein
VKPIAKPLAIIMATKIVAIIALLLLFMDYYYNEG